MNHKKLVIRRSMQYNGYEVYLYEDSDDGRIIPYEVSITKGDPVDYGMIVKPAFIIPSNNLDLDPTEGKFEGKFEQIKADKKEHIDNLNEIIRRILNQV